MALALSCKKEGSRGHGINQNGGRGEGSDIFKANVRIEGYDDTCIPTLLVLPAVIGFSVSKQPDKVHRQTKKVLSARADENSVIFGVEYDEDDFEDDEYKYNSTSELSSSKPEEDEAVVTWSREEPDRLRADNADYVMFSGDLKTQKGDEMAPDHGAELADSRTVGNVRPSDIGASDPTPVSARGMHDLDDGGDWLVKQKNRKKLIRKTCEERAYLPRKRIYDTHVIVDKGTNLLYCPVEKVASTFMRRFMYTLKQRNKTRTMASPFDVPVDVALDYEFDTLRTLFYEGITDFVDSSTKVLLARDPYSRLFAAYIDKLLVPNYYYWKKWAAPAISAYRMSPSAQALKCGHDVTFTEFLKYVVDSLHTSDPHLRPVNQMCSPCEMDYNIVGQLETLSDDFSHLTRVLDIVVANYSSETMATEIAIDSIVDYTYSAFESFQQLGECVSKLQVCRRLWHLMQVKGIISYEIRFSLTEEDMATMTPSKFVRILDKGRTSWTDTAVLLRQKQGALEEAYRQVPDSLLLQISAIYSLDFQMFGYDKYPSYKSLM